MLSARKAGLVSASQGPYEEVLSNVPYFKGEESKALVACLLNRVYYILLPSTVTRAFLVEGFPQGLQAAVPGTSELWNHFQPEASSQWAVS